MTETIEATYFCNMNLRGKYFDGFRASDTLVLVGEITVEAENIADALNQAYRGFNRIDQPVPVLDNAEAPSMSVGDVVYLCDDEGNDGWYAVDPIGFRPLETTSEHLHLELNRPVREVIAEVIDQINEAGR